MEEEIKVVELNMIASTEQQAILGAENGNACFLHQPFYPGGWLVQEPREDGEVIKFHLQGEMALPVLFKERSNRKRASLELQLLVVEPVPVGCWMSVRPS